MPYIKTCPGDTLKEHLSEIGMSSKSFAKKTGLTVNLIKKIISGTAEITPNTALLFENVLKISDKFWLNLEKIYRAEIEKNV